jgi:hypothetical protein
MEAQPKRFRFGLAKLLLAVTVCAVAFWLATNNFALMVAVIVVGTLAAFGTVLRIALAPTPDEKA